MARSGPPAYAWDWFSRQRLLWRESRGRLASSGPPVAGRYAAIDTRAETMALLRTDYGRDDVVRTTVDGVVAEIAFLSRTDQRFSRLGLTSAPRGLRWWWTALTGEELDRANPAPEPAAQLSFDALDTFGQDDVNEGYGDR